jgi:hypothetical protein
VLAANVAIAVVVDAKPGSLALLALSLIVAAGAIAWFAVQGQEADERLQRHFELSLDLFGTANFDGYFEALNPAWEN